MNTNESNSGPKGFPLAAENPVYLDLFMKVAVAERRAAYDLAAHSGFGVPQNFSAYSVVRHIMRNNNRKQKLSRACAGPTLEIPFPLKLSILGPISVVVLASIPIGW